mgnify:CR=1 FL=1
MKKQRRLPASFNPPLQSLRSAQRTESDEITVPTPDIPIIPSTLKLPPWVSIVYCATFEQCQSCCIRIAQAMELHSSTELCVCGLDFEWRVTFQAGKQRPIALMQLFFGMEVFLFHFYAFRDRGLPVELTSLLANHKLIKTGLNINNDIAKLERDFPSLVGVVRGVCDLRTVSKACEFAICNRQTVKGDTVTDVQAANISWPGGSLDNMVEKISQLTNMSVANVKWGSTYRRGVRADGRPDLSLPLIQLPKPGQVRCGNWESWPLSPDQREYASLDAYASFLVFHCLSKLYVQVHLPPALPSAEGQKLFSFDDTQKVAVVGYLSDFDGIVHNVLSSSKYGIPPPPPHAEPEPEPEPEPETETEGASSSELGLGIEIKDSINVSVTAVSVTVLPLLDDAQFSIKLLVPPSPSQ